MNISSRTPEGAPNRCPVCASVVRIEPSLPLGDAPCPNCGTLLWFLNLRGELHLFESDQPASVRETILDLIAKKVGKSEEALRTDPSAMNDLDSLEIVELVMELEEKLE